MPKAAPSKAAKESNPHVLKRHQACHQCRKRKMKCDAKRPCSSCVRSHAYALMHAPPGTPLPNGPECTFDEVAELVYTADDDHEERYSTLESRILELENLLRTKDAAAAAAATASPSSTDRSPEASSSTNTNDAISLSGNDANSTPDSGESLESDFLAQAEQMWKTANATADSQSPVSFEDAFGSPIGRTKALNPTWPRHLPPVGVLRHLTDAFFAFHMDAHHILHAPSFMASLSYAPEHPQFPATPLLHAICAIGHIYSSSATTWNVHESGARHLGVNFSDQQAKYAKRLIDDSIGLGQDFVQHLKANILLSWYYWWQARWIEVYTRVAMTLRIAVSLGLNLAPQFTCITSNMRPASLIPPAATTLDDELRRNTFWVAYALERQYGSSNGWALSLDDQDVFQLLPLSEQYDSTRSAPDPNTRQLSQSNEMLLIHPPDQTDSFVLYIKSTMLLSRVKNFNLRTRSRYFAQDPSLPQGYPISDVRFDPRETPEFGAMSSLALAFTDSLPNRYKDPALNEIVDPYIYSTLTAPLVTIILLHEPYAMVGKDSCLSAYHILTSARSIANLLHTIVSADYDCAKLGLFPVFAWFTSARVLTRFLRAAQEEKYIDQVTILTDEISFIMAVLRKLGERVPLSCRYGRMLEDHIFKTCGEGITAKIRITDPGEPDGAVGFAPEMQEGETADTLLSLRLASLDAVQAAGHVVTSSGTSFWPSSLVNPS